jgi:putative restriction endonuclease
LLFDGGLISFADNGDLLISPAADIDSLKKMGLPVGEDFNVGSFTERQRYYLEHHRRDVFRAASLV